MYRLKTRFKIGDKIWIVHNCKAIQIEVCKIIVSEKGISYMDKNLICKPQEWCFPTREALVLYMISEIK